MPVEQCSNRYPHESHWHKVRDGELHWQWRIVICPGIDAEEYEDMRREEEDRRDTDY